MTPGLAGNPTLPESHHTRRCTDSRRRQLIGALVAAPFVITPTRSALAAPRKLRFLHTHTGEKLNLGMRADGIVDRDALAEVNWFLRDFRTGESHPINPQLLTALFRVQKMTGSNGTYQIISGFRSPQTNDMLRSRSQQSGVAKKSHHMTGNAIDVRLTGLKTASLRRAAINLNFGGVGYYPKSDFIHIDTGRVRSW